MRAVLAISCIMLLSVGTARAQTFEGHAIAKDGDDLVIGEIDIRLFGIDAFELHQMCEADSKMYPCGSLPNKTSLRKFRVGTSTANSATTTPNTSALSQCVRWTERI
jgi:hypothetical protein